MPFQLTIKCLINRTHTSLPKAREDFIAVSNHVCDLNRQVSSAQRTDRGEVDWLGLSGNRLDFSGLTSVNTRKTGLRNVYVLFFDTESCAAIKMKKKAPNTIPVNFHSCV